MEQQRYGKLPILTDRKGGPALAFDDSAAEAHTRAAQHGWQPQPFFAGVEKAVAQNARHGDDPSKRGFPRIRKIVVSLLNVVS